MPTVTTVQPYLPVKESLVSPQTGALTPVGLQWFQQQAGNISAMASSLNTVPGVNLFTVATQPTLAAGDVGFVGIVTDVNHITWWDGASWQPWGNDQAGFYDLPVAPSGNGWQLCDGTATTYLVFGATLTLVAFTTPNLIATPAYRKAAAAYTGTINAKGGSTGTGTTGTGTTGTGTTGDESSHTHLIPSVSIQSGGVGGLVGGSTASIIFPGATSFGGSVHNHSVPGLSVPGLSVPALGVGSIEMANLGCLPYFRR
jgi:hypothetical protein